MYFEQQTRTLHECSVTGLKEKGNYMLGRNSDGTAFKVRKSRVVSVCKLETVYRVLHYGMLTHCGGFNSSSEKASKKYKGFVECSVAGRIVHINPRFYKKVAENG